MKNTPYVKKYEISKKTGLLVVSNPITKENPYLTEFETSKQKRDLTKRKKGNLSLIVTNLGKGLICKTTFTTVIFKDFIYQFRSNKVKRKYKTVIFSNLSYNK